MKVDGLTEIRVKLRAAANPLVVNKAILSLYADMRQRIFMEGLAADGGRIGGYSTKPLYVNPKDLPRAVSPKGKTGKTTFKNGEPHVTRYFPGGWKDVRNQTGRRIDTVNLDFTGGTKSAFAVDFSTSKPQIGFLTDLAGEIAAGNEKHFGKEIFNLTKEELDSFDAKISAALAELGI